MYPLLGLNLLRLLAQNRISEFHTQLELIDAEQIHSNIYIRHPVQVGQCVIYFCSFYNGAGGTMDHGGKLQQSMAWTW